ncbi:MAG: NAD-dependent epimerase/dehydratase family protein [Nocardiopsaceae bacterium]|jgi:nucleoside-diphosphate-sugar epimerase|nr:NAD-dependent epimerase/dehydratase family protein [Nocardiopsaceae bacterium]
MRIFIAGATGVLGIRLVRLLVAAGYVVAGMTRSPGKTVLLRDAGAEPVVCDVFDAAELTSATTEFAPDVVYHQLTDLPDKAGEITAYRERNNRIRTEGTRNLLEAAAIAGARVIAQSISWENTSSGDMTAAFERMIIEFGGVVIRYGQLWGPGTHYEAAPPDPPRIHVDDAARLSVPVLGVSAGMTVVADDRAIGTLL